ncbi:MAG: hypothetical protein AVDCRST_MAG11-623, partial [uncultured Gemmatimonadaceae bacterium]
GPHQTSRAAGRPRRAPRRPLPRSRGGQRADHHRRQGAGVGRARDRQEPRRVREPAAPPPRRRLRRLGRPLHGRPLRGLQAPRPRHRPRPRDARRLPRRVHERPALVPQLPLAAHRQPHAVRRPQGGPARDRQLVGRAGRARRRAAGRRAQPRARRAGARAGRLGARRQGAHAPHPQGLRARRARVRGGRGAHAVRRQPAGRGRAGGEVVAQPQEVHARLRPHSAEGVARRGRGAQDALPQVGQGRAVGRLRRAPRPRAHPPGRRAEGRGARRLRPGHRRARGADGAPQDARLRRQGRQDPARANEGVPRRGDEQRARRARGAQDDRRGAARPRRRGRARGV